MLNYPIWSNNLSWRSCSPFAKKFKHSNFLTGGAISDLVSRITALENSGLRFPDLSTRNVLVSAQGDIVPGWNNNDVTYIPITMQADGWIKVWAHAENADSSSKLARRRVRVKLNGNLIADADATWTITDSHTEDSDCVMVPVKKGNIISYGSDVDGNTTDPASPNGSGNLLTITWFGLLK